MKRLLGKLACWFGLHDCTSEYFAFGYSLERCVRCGYTSVYNIWP